jgi:hypothetical protein
VSTKKVGYTPYVFAMSAEGTDSKGFSFRFGAKECRKSVQRFDF